MKLSYISLVLFFQSTFAFSEVFSNPKEIESEASRYRMLAIECITDKKITKKETLTIESCKELTDFVKSKYPNLKASLENAQQQVKVTANSEGLESGNIRETLILLMSARSHMQVAGEISTKI
jgi:predicted phage tail protein